MGIVEITAIYQDERIRFNNPHGDVVICHAEYVDGQKPECVKGRFGIKGPDSGFEIHQTYRLYGRWSSYRNKRTGKTEPQFHFETAVKAQPHSRAGVICYLQAAGKGCGIGRAKATKLWEAFGADAVRLAREKPAVVVAAIKGLSSYQAAELAANLQELATTEHVSIELLDLLDRRGFPKTIRKQCLDQWGNKAAEVIKRNPYQLMRFKGGGFKRCDQMYLDLGHPPGRLKRQALCAWYTLASDTHGHTWFPASFIVNGIKSQVSLEDDDNCERALRLATRAKLLDEAYVDKHGQLTEGYGIRWLAEKKKARNERYVARCLTDAIEEPTRWPSIEEVSRSQPAISKHQAETLHQAMTAPIAVFGGSPGTGKSFCAAGLIGAIIKRHGSKAVACAAPTGKAAVRMTEAMQANKLNLTAKTIHSTLKIDMADDSDFRWLFVHRENNPLPFKYLIIDESSMIDTDLMSAIMAARGKGTHILFVGDVNQLPPVGHGAPLRDMILAGLPYGELKEIQRNSGRIVHACAQMRDGLSFKVSESIDLKSGENLHCLGGHEPKEMLWRLEDALDFIRDMNFDPIWQTQVVVPVNKKSPLCRIELNQILQSRLNTNPGELNQPFRLGDKVINNKNRFFEALKTDGSDEVQQNNYGEVYVANGELGEVTEVAEKYFIVRLQSPDRTILVPRGSQVVNNSDDGSEPSTGCSWDLGFAISVHKSQGAEWPVVIVVLDEYPGARMICDRSWVYTAVSRAKSLCLLLGRVETAHRFCRKTKIYDRQTFLVELIKGEQGKRLLTEM